MQDDPEDEQPSLWEVIGWCAFALAMVSGLAFLLLAVLVR
jgi:hypothetical protein